MIGNGSFYTNSTALAKTNTPAHNRGLFLHYLYYAILKL